MLASVLLTLLGSFHPFEVPHLAQYEGRSMAGVTVSAFAQSEIIDNLQVVELTLQGTHRWQSHCVKRFIRGQFRLICDVESPGQPALRVSLTDATDAQWRGEVRLPEPVRFEGEARPDQVRLDGIRMLGGRFIDAQGVPFAIWSIVPRPFSGQSGRGLQLTDPQPAERLERVAVLALTLNIAGDRWPTGGPTAVYDGYRLTGGALPDRWHVDQPDHAALMDSPSFMQGAPRLDRAAGVLIEREGHFGRVIVEFAGGAITEQADRASTDVFDGFALTVGGGLRLGARSQLNINMGAQVGVFKNSVGRFEDGRFDLGLHLRQAFELGTVLEPVIGARLRGHLRFADATSLDGREQADAAQLGWGIAPTVGLQWPWALNRFDTRLVVFLEAAPEWTFWTQPDLDASTDVQRAMQARMGPRSRQLTTVLGVRFEL